MNQELYDQMLNAGKVVLYRELQAREISNLNEEMNNDEMHLNHKKSKINAKPYGGMIGFGIALLSLGLLFDFVMIILTFSNILILGFSEFLKVEGASSFIAVFFIFLPFWIIGIVLIITGKILRKKYKIKATKEYEAESQKFADSSRTIKEKAKRISDDLTEFNAEYSCFLEFLPSKYHTSSAVAFMLEAIYNLRVETLKEAINLYEEELHRLKLEKILDDNARMQQLQTERMLYAMDQINANQERINSNLKDIKIMQFADMVVN